MTQRATIEDTSVYAFQADDEVWGHWKELYKANKLTLPCCGGAAVPREHPVSGTRFFSHAPYAARTCLWKATGALHEDLVREACDVLWKLGWQVDTDRWLEDVAVDIIATNPDTEEHVAVMFETASVTERPDEKLIAENAQLQSTDLQAVLWLIPHLRYDSLREALQPLPFQRSEQNAENTIGNVAWLLRRWFEKLNEPEVLRSNQTPWDTSITSLRTFSPEQPPSEALTGIASDPDWSDGRSSLGSGDLRAKRITRLATRWLKPDLVDKWLNQPHATISFGNSPLGAAQMSAAGYLEAQNALSQDMPGGHQPPLIE